MAAGPCWRNGLVCALAGATGWYAPLLAQRAGMRPCWRNGLVCALAGATGWYAPLLAQRAGMRSAFMRGDKKISQDHHTGRGKAATNTLRKAGRQEKKRTQEVRVSTRFFNWRRALALVSCLPAFLRGFEILLCVAAGLKLAPPTCSTSRSAALQQRSRSESPHIVLTVPRRSPAPDDSAADRT